MTGMYGSVTMGHRELGPTDPASLRHWWHSILRRTLRPYTCYGIFLANLPADREAAEYLTKYATELNRMSGRHCLIIALGTTQFKASAETEGLWELAVDEQLSKGHSFAVADLFNIGYDEFPCLILFRDIRSPEHTVISLKEMTADEMAAYMRTVLSVVRKAYLDDEDPLQTMERHKHQEKLRRKGRAIVGQMTAIAEKSFQVAMEAWMEATMKQAGGTP
jgi:hypothetical protein